MDDLNAFSSKLKALMYSFWTSFSLSNKIPKMYNKKVTSFENIRRTTGSASGGLQVPVNKRSTMRKYGIDSRNTLCVDVSHDKSCVGVALNDQLGFQFLAVNLFSHRNGGSLRQSST